MKRIVNGVTYNTDTSTALGKKTWEDDGEATNQPQRQIEVLYVNRGGAYFIHEEKTYLVWNQREQVREERTDHSFIPQSADDAQKWLLEGDDVEVFDNPFGDPPEATAE